MGSQPQLTSKLWVNLQVALRELSPVALWVRTGHGNRGHSSVELVAPLCSNTNHCQPKLMVGGGERERKGGILQL